MVFSLVISMIGKLVFQTGRALADIISYYVSLTAFYGIKI